MRRLGVVLVVALATLVHALAWYLMQEPTDASDVVGPFNSLSFAPIAANKDAESDPATAEEIRADLATIAPYTRGVRTYSVNSGLEQVPELASEFGLRVTLGAWIDEAPGREEANEREIETAIQLAKTHRNIDSVIVGNETLYRSTLIDKGTSVPDLIEKIQRVKRQVSVPVSTAEVWNIWLDHPELVSAVDYLAVHILPYWEGIPAEAATEHAMNIYQRLRQAYPGKRVVIAEFGWPSAGLNRHAAVPDAMSQAKILRDFVAHADDLGMEYSIVEAFDQPWKVFEGSVGAYWGIFDANRHAKFELRGPVGPPNWLLKSIAALALGVLLCIPLFALPRVALFEAGMLAATAHLLGAWGSQVFDYLATHYFVLGSLIAAIIGAALLVPLLIIMKRRMDELATILLGSSPKRLLRPGSLAPEKAPLVSIHIPACREPPDMLRQTLDSIAKLDWPNFECILVVNNTPDPNMWEPVEEHCRKLGSRFKFVNAERLAGFKAGALRLALDHTDPKAEIIGVLDADYTVDPDWLKDLVPAFDTPSVGLVQAPQDHRDGGRSVLHASMNREYAGFFDIGMVQRNEVNAIVSHGTMCLLRRSALMDAGNWSSDTIVEDADLGLALMARGWETHYTSRRYGWGLLPSDFAAYKRQRHRWAYGGVQLIKKHWRAFLPGRSRITAQQRGEYLFGWLTWLGAESLGVLLAILNLAFVPFVAFGAIAVPAVVLTIPVLAAFGVMLLHFLALYRARVRSPFFASLGAAFAAMALQLTVARAVGEGLFKDGVPFLRTAKGSGGHVSERFPAFWEATFGLLLVGSALLLQLTNVTQAQAISIFSFVLLVQSLPFLAAVMVTLFERSSLNDFATWRRLASVATYRPRLPRGRAPTPGATGGEGNIGILP
jgi:exo-beta-1,3-glucanase (GH17 family)/cellulose synthase/poly-beta-1,6-N-acetylglucosamine synthase-like glycosyltransferase